ncbi:Uncharacterized protein QTN25_003578 [Entamoeba marina]
MNLCVFNIETIGSLFNEDYCPNRLEHILESMRLILKTNYFSSYAVIFSDSKSTVEIPPTRDRLLIGRLSSLKTSQEHPHHLRCLRQTLLLTKQRQWDSVHVVSYVTSEEALSDAVLRSSELQSLRNFHVQIIMLGDVLSVTSHTRSLLRWGVTEIDAHRGAHSYDRLLIRMSEGIAIVPQRKTPYLIPHMKSGQGPSESKAGKTVSCKIINYTANNTVSMIPVPIVARQKTLVTSRCGKCCLEKGKCVSLKGLGSLMVIELSPMLFKLCWRSDEGTMESITVIHGEAKAKVVKKNGQEFIVVECQRGSDKYCQNIYWGVSGCEDFCEVLKEAMEKEIPIDYTKLMETIWAENKKVLSRMEEKYLSMKREKDILNKVDEFSKSDMKSEVERIVGNATGKKEDAGDQVN